MGLVWITMETLNIKNLFWDLEGGGGGAWPFQKDEAITFDASWTMHYTPIHPQTHHALETLNQEPRDGLEAI